MTSSLSSQSARPKKGHIVDHNIFDTAPYAKVEDNKVTVRDFCTKYLSDYDYQIDYDCLLSLEMLPLPRHIIFNIIINGIKRKTYLDLTYYAVECTIVGLLCIIVDCGRTSYYPIN